MMMRVRPVMLGDVSTSGVLTAGAISGTVAGIGAGITSGNPLRGAAAAVGASMVALAPLTGPAAPFVAAAGAVISLFAGLFHGCGATCTQATAIANQFDQEFGQLKAQYFAQSPRTKTMQTAYLTAFDQVAAQMQQACGNPALGAAGQRCISERLVKGGTAPWCPNPGHTGCDWITAYRDPIANDTGVVADPPSVAGVLESSLGGSLSGPAGPGGVSNGLMLLALGLLVVGVVM